MRLHEIQTIKPLKPKKSMDPEKYLMYRLKQNKDNAKQAYAAEKDRQKIAKAQQQIFKAKH